MFASGVVFLRKRRFGYTRGVLGFTFFTTRWLSWYGVGLASADKLPVVVRIPAGPLGNLKCDPPKGNGRRPQKIIRSRKMGPSRSPSYFWDRMHSSVKEQKGKDFHGPILGPGGNHKIVKMQQRLTLQTKKGHSFKRSEVQPRKNCDLHPFVSRGKWDAFFIQSCS